MKDLEQKKRNKAIEITDIAISKIRKTEIPGFTTAQEQMIQELHKKLLKRAQQLNKLYKSKEMEAGIMVDLHTWQYWVIDGTKEREVEMKNNKEAYHHYLGARKNQLMFMHNHPSTGTFSGEDFKFFCLHDAFYMITVVGNDGTIYLLNKTVNFDARVVGKYTEIADEYYYKGYRHNNGTLAMRDVLKMVDKYGLEYKKGSHK